MTYQRNRRFSAEETQQRPTARPQLAVPSAPSENSSQSDPRKGIRIDGRQQVLDLLLAADPAFRESLLRKIASGDRLLAEQLRRRIDERLSE